MDNKLRRSLIAELIGTFTLVFIGAAVVTVAPDFGVVVPALGHGLILVGLIYAYGHISGAHFNPAVTLGLLVGSKIKPSDAGLYMAAQFIGGIIAGFALAFLMPDGTNLGQTTGSLTGENTVGVVVFEAILTFFLVSTIYQSAVFGRAGNLAAVAIGFTLAGSILAGGVYTGASLNPARTFGPALAAGDFSYFIWYFIGTFGGGVIAGLTQNTLLESSGMEEDPPK